MVGGKKGTLTIIGGTADKMRSKPLAEENQQKAGRKPESTLKTAKARG